MGWWKPSAPAGGSSAGSSAGSAAGNRKSSQAGRKDRPPEREEILQGKELEKAREIAREMMEADADALELYGP